MAEYIGCRNCESLDCKGCNLKNLETMLNNGKFDCMMNENRCINPAADVATVRHGWWIFGKDLPYSWGQIPKNKYHLYCSECLEQAFNRSEDNDPDFDEDTSYCPNCGAKMIKVSGGE